MLSCVRAPRGERKSKKKKKKKKRKHTSPNSQTPDNLESSSNPYSQCDNISNDISSSSQTVYGDVNEKLSSFSLQSSDDVMLTSATESFKTNDYNFSSSRSPQPRKKNKKQKAKGSRRKQNKSGDDDEGEEKADVDDGTQSISNRLLTADEMVGWYDKLFISMYPDDRFEEITASHNHLRHWSYYPKPQDGTARTSHEKQWIEEHRKAAHGSQRHPNLERWNLIPSVITNKSDFPERPSLHEEYLTQRNSLRISLDSSTSSRGSGRSTRDRPPLWQLAGYSSMKEINPVKINIAQTLMNRDEPTVKGVLLSKKQSA